MYCHRTIIVQSAPDWAAPSSAHHRLHFSSWKPPPRFRTLLDATNAKEWDELHDRCTPSILKILGDPMLSASPPWTRANGHCTMSGFERWARLADPNVVHDPERMAESLRILNIRRKTRAFNDVRIPNGADGFIELFVDALIDNDVVLAVMPPGYGKTISAQLIVEKVVHKQNMKRLMRPDGTVSAVNRKALDRPLVSLSKSLHLVPTATNAASAAQFLENQGVNPGVSGYIHPLLNYKGEFNPSGALMEHALVPYKDAEWFLDVGRFKMVIIDEVHSDDSAASSCLLRTLNAMGKYDETDSNAPDCPRRRVDKCLIMTGTNSPSLENEIRTLVSAHTHLKFDTVKVPHLDSEWEQRRHSLNKNMLYSVNSSAPHNSYNFHTPLSDDLAQMLRYSMRIRTDEELKAQDQSLAAPEGIFELPKFVVGRINSACRALMIKFNVEAAGHRELIAAEGARVSTLERENRELRGAKNEELAVAKTCLNQTLHNPYRYPTILIFVPSTGAAKEAYNVVRFNSANMFCPKQGYKHRIKPYRVTMCSRTIDIERELAMSAADEPCKYTLVGPAPPDWGTHCTTFMKGRVLIIVNGSEVGLTIDRVGGIIESGVERLRTSQLRSGISSNVFKLSDHALVDQRAGRGGRTRISEHILCLGAWGVEQLERRGGTILDEKRRGNHTIVDYMRQLHNPEMKNLRTMKSDNWNETVVEGRVCGSLVEQQDHMTKGDRKKEPLILEELSSGETTLKVEPAFNSLSLSACFPNVNPTHTRLLLALTHCRLALHGIIRVALLTTQLMGVMKPSKGNKRSTAGVHPLSNCVDIFKDATSTMFHRGLDGEKKYRTRPYYGDIAAFVDMHAQLIIASKWNIASEVPTREELLASDMHPDNFFCGAWLPCGPAHTLKMLKNCMTPRTAKEMANRKAFIYGRLFVDEERKALWSAIRHLAYDLTLNECISSPRELLKPELNHYVHNLDTDPLLTARGRTLLSAVDTMYSSRFAMVTPDYENYTQGQGKPRGHFYDYYMKTEKSETGRTIIRQNKILRRMSNHTKWIRFDPATASTRHNSLVPANSQKKKNETKNKMQKKESKEEKNKKKTAQVGQGAAQSTLTTTTTELPEQQEEAEDEEEEGEYEDEEVATELDDLAITFCDPITDLQAALFANAAGRWRLFKEEENGDEKKKKEDMLTLEIELNARTSYYGMTMSGNKAMMLAVGSFRNWLKHNMPYSRYRIDPNKNYERAVELLVELWEMSDERPLPPPRQDKPPRGMPPPPVPPYLD